MTYFSTHGFWNKAFHETSLLIRIFFFNFQPTPSHLHSLQVENYDSNSRLVVIDEDDNNGEHNKVRLESVNLNRCRCELVIICGENLKMTFQYFIDIFHLCRRIMNGELSKCYLS